MAEYRARVVLLLRAEDAERLGSWLLRDWLEEGEKPDLAQAGRLAREENGPDCGFLYEMIAEPGYGSSIPGTERLTFEPVGNGMQAAVFTWESEEPFQPEDWLCLHRHAGQAPLFAMYAGDEFGLEKGEGACLGGYWEPDWDHMAEVWVHLWLLSGKEQAEPQDLKRLRRAFELECWEQEPEEAVEGCLALRRDAAEPPEPLAEEMKAAASAQEFARLAELQRQLIRRLLWR